MNVNVFDPKSPQPRTLDVSMTPRAIAHVKRQMDRMSGKALRLGVKESGCSGYMYELDYIDAPGSEDHTVKIDAELKIYVRNQHLALIRGTEIDYVTEGLNSALRFKNPNAEAECGCGESFSVGKETSV